jgi:hypothetical protein
MKVASLILICIVFAGSSIVLNACCKAYCFDSELHMRFIHFDKEEIDTVVLVRYEPNGQFNHKLDSTYEYLFTPQSDTMHFFVENADLNSDFTIKVPATGNEYPLSDINTRSERCQCSGDRIKMVTSYKLHGNHVNSETVDLVK